MGSKFFLSLILLSSSWVFLGLSEAPKGEGPGGAVAAAPDCVKKLLPCQAFVKNPASPPPSCCVPMKQLLVEDPKCMCDVYNDAGLLKNLNVTQDDMLKLPKGCGVTVDVARCEKLEAGPSGNSSAASPVPATSNGTAANSTESPKKSSVDGLSPFSVICFIATFVALLSAF